MGVSRDFKSTAYSTGLQAQGTLCKLFWVPASEVKYTQQGLYHYDIENKLHIKHAHSNRFYLQIVYTFMYTMCTHVCILCVHTLHNDV